MLSPHLKIIPLLEPHQEFLLALIN